MTDRARSDEGCWATWNEYGRLNVKPMGWSERRWKEYWRNVMRGRIKPWHTEPDD